MKTERRAFLIKVDGTVHLKEPLDGKKFSLEEAQELVGGYVQMIRVRPAMVALLDEEGLFKSLPENREATRILKEESGKNWGTIRGPVLICHYHMF